MKANRDGHSIYTLAVTVQTNPNILPPVAHSTGRKPTNSDDLVALISSINRRMGVLGSTVAKKIFPPHTHRLQTLTADAGCSFIRTIAPFPLPKSIYHHSVQRTIRLSSLGYSGRSHIDRHDDPMSLTLLICISNLVDTPDPGKFYIGEKRECCTLCISVFSLDISWHSTARRDISNRSRTT